MVTATLPPAVGCCLVWWWQRWWLDWAFGFLERKLEVISEQASLEIGQGNLKLFLQAFLYVGKAGTLLDPLGNGSFLVFGEDHENWTYRPREHKTVKERGGDDSQLSRGPSLRRSPGRY